MRRESHSFRVRSWSPKGFPAPRTLAGFSLANSHQSLCIAIQEAPKEWEFSVSTAVWNLEDRDDGPRPAQR
ncbi:uncharacterized protein CLUP02_11742 [Colletotrichum lupini]|uniref:Uncharacterized protein n=1 Tax=Colletotrichum lupini TaxID=145971 RepID=A0A9Q8WKL2_9PEZI|nr:uncharacterized protein CLUP02_11742 [Colletotrichum lupini]UQC86242.1 hypothetical protein CLUP02_11742 [Colletotrichum lupini]